MNVLRPFFAEGHLQVDHLRIECKERRHIPDQLDGNPLRQRIVGVDEQELSQRTIEIRATSHLKLAVRPGRDGFRIDACGTEPTCLNGADFERKRSSVGHNDGTACWLIHHNRAHFIGRHWKFESRSRPAHGSARCRSVTPSRTPIAGREEAQHDGNKQQPNRQSGGQVRSDSGAVGRRVQLTSDAGDGLTPGSAGTVLTNRDHAVSDARVDVDRIIPIGITARQVRAFCVNTY